MYPEKHGAILQRLRSAEGHLQAVTKMVENENPCEKVIHQLLAVEAALRAIMCLLIDEQIKLKQVTICQADSLEERSEALEQLISWYQMINKSRVNKFFSITQQVETGT